MATAEHIAPKSFGAANSKKRVLPLPVLIYLIVVVVPFHFNAGPVLLTGVRAFLLVLIVPLTIKLFTGKFGRLVFADFLFFLHMGWAAIALSVNNPDRTVQFIGSNAVEFLGGYILARAYVRSPEVLMAVWKVLFVVVILTLPLAAFEAVTARPIAIEIISKLPGIQSLANIVMESRMGLDRAQVVFAHPIHYGLFCSVTFSLCVVGMKKEWGNFRRLLTTGMICTGVFLSLSSGALLPVALQIGLIIWAAVFDKLKARWMLLMSLIVLAYITIDLLSNRTPIRVFMSYATFSPHNAFWRGLIFEYGIQNVWDSPVFGIGLNDWKRPGWMHASTVDNFWLLIAMQFGIPGFILLVIGYFEILIRIGVSKVDADPVTWRLRRAYMFSFIGMTLTLSTVHVWTNIYSFTFFMLGSGVWFIFAKPQAPSDAPEIEEEASGRRPNLARISKDAPVLARGRAPEPTPKKETATLSRPKEDASAKRRGDGVPFTRFPNGSEPKRRR
ncbi:O-antigen ligase family protein [Aliiroseovarius sp. 2305UL8-7]|uniref:O-antigen ligase family protein n=1 Tax=Aliiroseovarius conchicola TaxID=3121637 RepID=UPI0035283A67